MRWVSGQKHQTSEILNTVEILIFSHNSTAQMGVSDTHGVSCWYLCTAALWRCALYMFCCLSVVYVLVDCVLVREGNKNRHFFTGAYVQNRPQKEKPGKSSYPLPKKRKKRAPTTRATVLGSSSNLDDRFRTAFLCRRSFMVLAKSARTNR